jgi:hypothetical protein
VFGAACSCGEPTIWLTHEKRSLWMGSLTEISILWALGEMMGTGDCRTLGKSQSALMMIDPMISSRTRRMVELLYQQTTISTMASADLVSSYKASGGSRGWHWPAGSLPDFSSYPRAGKTRY